jgi:hypothetical protein
MLRRPIYSYCMPSLLHWHELLLQTHGNITSGCGKESSRREVPPFTWSTSQEVTLLMSGDNVESICRVSFIELHLVWSFLLRMRPPNFLKASKFYCC